jgi:OmpA-OmpF porin, OOP family
MQKAIALSGLALLGLVAGAAANADVTPGFYAGASVGQTSIDLDDVPFDESDTSFKVFGGYSFNQHFAVELGYFDGGSQEADFGFGDSVSVELGGLVASAVGRLPMGESFALFGKVGFASYDAEVTGRVNGVVVIQEDGSDEDITYGVGGEFDFGQFGLRAEYELLDVDGADVTMLSVGGFFRF